MTIKPKVKNLYNVFSYCPKQAVNLLESNYDKSEQLQKKQDVCLHNRLIKLFKSQKNINRQDNCISSDN